MILPGDATQVMPDPTIERLRRVRAGRGQTYCVVSSEAPARVERLIRQHFGHDDAVVVYVDRRQCEGRRVSAGALVDDPRASETAGRRRGPRRCSVLVGLPRGFPSELRPHRALLQFAQPARDPEEDVLVLELVERLRHDPSNKAAKHALYETYLGPLRAYLHRVLDDPQDAEELTQEVFSRAFEKLPNFTGDGPFRAWLFRIGRNRVIDHNRQRESDLLSLSGLEQRADPRHHDWILNLDVVNAIKQLSREHAQALLLSCLTDLSTQDIASIMGCSVSTVSRRKRQAIAILNSFDLRGEASGETSATRSWSRTRLRTLPVIGRRRFALGRRLGKR